MIIIIYLFDKLNKKEKESKKKICNGQQNMRSNKMVTFSNLFLTSPISHHQKLKQLF